MTFVSDIMGLICHLCGSALYLCVTKSVLEFAE